MHCAFMRNSLSPSPSPEWGIFCFLFPVYVLFSPVFRRFPSFPSSFLHSLDLSPSISRALYAGIFLYVHSAGLNPACCGGFFYKNVALFRIFFLKNLHKWIIFRTFAAVFGHLLREDMQNTPPILRKCTYNQQNTNNRNAIGGAR